MARGVIGLLGAVMAMFPERTLEVYEKLAFENPGESTPNGNLGRLIRAEGLLFTILSVSGGTAFAWLMNVSGVAGAVAFLFPRQYLRFGLDLAYTHSDTIEVNRRFVDAVRVLGALFLLLALREFSARGSDD